MKYFRIRGHCLRTLADWMLERVFTGELLGTAIYASKINGRLWICQRIGRGCQMRRSFRKIGVYRGVHDIVVFNNDHSYRKTVQSFARRNIRMRSFLWFRMESDQRTGSQLFADVYLFTLRCFFFLLETIEFYRRGTFSRYRIILRSQLSTAKVRTG